jgi:hypothetical protein
VDVAGGVYVADGVDVDVRGGGCGVNAPLKVGCLMAAWPRAPLLPGADVLAFIDIDSTQKRACGHKKQGARFGHTKIQGKSVLVTFLLVFCCLPVQRAADAAASSRAPVTPDRSGVPGSGAIVISDS